MVNVYRVTFGLIILLSSAASYALDVTASIDRNPAVVDESLTLTVIAQDSLAADAFDPSVLAADFVVGRTSISSQTSMVNFKTTRTTRWTTLLIPTKPGVVTIPALQVAGGSTNPITLTVLAAGNNSSQQQKDVYITSDVAEQNVYVQQQFTLTVRLHLAADLKRGNIADPKMTGAEIRQIGDNKDYPEIINGRRFRIIERVYSVKPQTSGDFVLHGIVFDGEIVKQSNQRRSLFGALDTGTPVRVKGEDLNITVKPAEPDFAGEWLPSELIVAEQQWPQQQQPYKIGEPITRTVTLTAAALSADQLPDINFSAPDGIKIYPDQAESQMTVQNGVLVSQKVQDFAIVPTQAGTFTLPELRIPWWNTKLNRQEFAVIPAKTLTIEASQTAVTSATPAPQTVQTVPVVEVQSSIWQWIFLAGWIGTALAWLYVAKLKSMVKAKFKTGTGLLTFDKHYYLQLLAACKQNNGEQVLSLLPLWGNELMPNSNMGNLQQLLDNLQDSELNQAVSELQQSYFAKQRQPWQGNSLIKVVSRIQTRTIQKQQVEFALNP